MTDRPTVLIGAAGQLGSDLRAAWPELRPGERLVGLDHAEADVTDPAALRATLERLEPRAVLNMAAFHRVDDIEDDARLAFQVNAVGAGDLAGICRDLDSVLLHVSTDYVFSGDADRPYAESDPVAPINAYGVTKVAGEQLIRYRWQKHFIVRSCGLYGIAGSAGKGGNFVETMLRLAGEGRDLKVVHDQVLTPTATRPLAEQICELTKTDAYGTYHATCQGECSWFDFAAEIFRQAGLSPVLRPQTTVESGARARRPAYSVLRNGNLEAVGLDRLPSWQEALRGYLAARAARSAAG